MPPFDVAVPVSLRRTQEWFGGVIARPIGPDSAMQPISPQGAPMAVEAGEYIAPSPTLQPHQRIQIYNQQYWWRLLKALQETYPLVHRLFGTAPFNETIAKPYLQTHPPRHWSLHFLGDRLPGWIDQHYGEQDKRLVHDAACIDWAFEHAYLAEELPPLEASDPVAASQPLCLQGHVHLFQLGYNLMAFRDEFIKQSGDYWVDHDFPDLPMDRDYHFVVFRGANGEIIWHEIGAAQYTLLSYLKNNCSIEQACQRLEDQHPNLVAEAMGHIHLWFQEWAIRRWLCRGT